jgi:prepilin-type processing-associated H-X9-DG protein
VELLLVVAIVGILAALLLGSVSSVVEKSRSVECLSNLRQIYFMSLRFAADQDGYTPQAYWFVPPPKPVWLGANLTDYGFNEKLGCPSFRKISPDLTYGINFRLVSGPPGVWGDRNIYFNLHGRYKFLAFPKPAATLFFFDTSGLIVGRTTTAYASNPGGADYRHGKKANAVFLDGHAAALTPEEVTNAYSADLLPGS